MVEIKNCRISTETSYGGNSRDKRFFLKIEVPIPGGEAVYRIPTSETINSSLEKATQLSPKEIVEQGE